MHKGLNSLSLISLIFTTLSGCSMISDTLSRHQGIGKVTKDIPHFANATIIKMSPAPLHKKESRNSSVELGGQWSSRFPDAIILMPSFSQPQQENRRTDIEEIDVTIDGDVSKFKVNRSTNLCRKGCHPLSNNHRKSRNYIIIPFDYLEQMMNADDCQLRVYTANGHDDSHFSVERIPGGQGTAKRFMHKFISTIKSSM